RSEPGGPPQAGGRKRLRRLAGVGRQSLRLGIEPRLQRLEGAPDLPLPGERRGGLGGELASEIGVAAHLPASYGRREHVDRSRLVEAIALAEEPRVAAKLGDGIEENQIALLRARRHRARGLDPASDPRRVALAAVLLEELHVVLERGDDARARRRRDGLNALLERLGLALAALLAIEIGEALERGGELRALGIQALGL